MRFKKIVRSSWISQVKKFHKFSKKKIMKIITEYTENNGIKIDVRYLLLN